MGTYVDYEKSLAGIQSRFPERISKERERFREHPEFRPQVSEDYLRDLAKGSAELERLFEEMLDYLYRYTADVCEHESLRIQGVADNAEQLAELDKKRTQLHDTTIDAVRIFARNLAKNGKDNQWIRPMEDKGRAGYAAFAVLTTFQDIIRNYEEQQTHAE